MSVVALGTAGGPRWNVGPAGGRHGISTAVVVGEAVYLVDLGVGAGLQLARAGIDVSRVRGVFITHLHSDHIADLASLLLLAPWALGPPSERGIPIYGPSDPGGVGLRTGSLASQIVAPDCPTPGLAQTFATLERAFAADLNDRIRDTLKPPPSRYFDPRDIQLPDDWRPELNAEHPMAPVEIHADEFVTVTAVLVSHPPMEPAYGFRFESSSGSVVISGDTAPSANLERLAQGASLLMHEALDFDGILAARPPIDTWTDSARATFEHHRKAHTSPRDAVLLAERAGVARLALHHLAPADTPVERWRAVAGGFAGELLVPSDLDVIEVSAHRPTARANRSAR